MQSEYLNNSTAWLQFDWRPIMDNTLENRAKQIIAVVILAFGIAGAVPLITAVHGQQPRTALEAEVLDARDRIGKIELTMQNLPVLIGTMAEHQRAQDKVFEDWHRHEQDFEDHILWGLLGLGGSALLAIFGWAISHFVVITKGKGRSTA